MAMSLGELKKALIQEGLDVPFFNGFDAACQEYKNATTTAKETEIERKNKEKELDTKLFSSFKRIYIEEHKEEIENEFRRSKKAEEEIEIGIEKKITPLRERKIRSEFNRYKKYYEEHGAVPISEIVSLFQYDAESAFEEHKSAKTALEKEKKKYDNKKLKKEKNTVIYKVFSLYCSYKSLDPQDYNTADTRIACVNTLRKELTQTLNPQQPAPLPPKISPVKKFKESNELSPRTKLRITSGVFLALGLGMIPFCPPLTIFFFLLSLSAFGSSLTIDNKKQVKTKKKNLSSPHKLFVVKHPKQDNSNQSRIGLTQVLVTQILKIVAPDVGIQMEKKLGVLSVQSAISTNPHGLYSRSYSRSKDPRLTPTPPSQSRFNSSF